MVHLWALSPAQANSRLGYLGWGPLGSHTTLAAECLSPHSHGDPSRVQRHSALLRATWQHREGNLMATGSFCTLSLARMHPRTPETPFFPSVLLCFPCL